MMNKYKKRSSILALVLISTATISISGSSASALKQASFSTNNAKLTFTGKTVAGKTFSSKTLANKKPTVIWFWAPWCAICKNESTFIVDAAEKYKGRVNFLGIGALGSKEEMVDFVDHTGTSIFTNLNDGDGKLWNRFGVVIQPTIVFVDAKGKISSKVGPSDEESFEKKLKELTKKR